MKQLSKQVESMALTFTPGINTWSKFDIGGDYTEISMSSNNCRLIANQGYFDLAGLSMEQKTLFLKNAALQLQVPPNASDAVAGDALEIITMMSDVPISELDITAGAGWALSTMSADNCFLRRVQTWAVSTDSGSFASFFQLMNETVDGMATDTTSDRIYYAVYVRLIIKKVGPAEVSPINNITIPGIRFVIEADVKEEPDFVYLMRQRRAYELQNAPDVD